MRVSPYRFLFLTSLSTLALTACGSSDTIPKAKSDAPMPPIAEMDAAMVPFASSAGTPAGLMVSDTLTPIAANPALSPAAPSGILTPEERLARLETSVMALQNEYKRMAPAFSSLNTTNQRIQSLLDELEATGKTMSAAQKPPAAPAPASTLVPIPGGDVSLPSVPVHAAPQSQHVAVTPHAPVGDTPKPPQNMPAPAVLQTDLTVKNVRIGEHGAKTRLVLDLTGKKKPPFTYDLDNGEKLLMVELPATWAGKESGAPKSPMISGWKVQPSPQGGSILAVQLTKSARVQSTQFLGPEGKDPARLVLDIVPTN